MALYPIFTRRVGFRLEKRGFKIIKIQPNKRNPDFNVYYFEDTLELHNALVEATKNKKK